jgi:HEAT repeat protein
MTILLLLACRPSVDSVIGGLASENPIAREEMAREASSVDDARVVEALIAALQDRSVEVRRNAVESLGALGARDAVPSLCDLVENDPAVGVQRAAITALARLGDARAVPVLLRDLDVHRDAPPLDAIWALGEIGDPSAAGSLARALKDSSAEVRKQAAWALGELKSQE